MFCALEAFTCSFGSRTKYLSTRHTDHTTLRWYYSPKNLVCLRRWQKFAPTTCGYLTRLTWYKPIHQYLSLSNSLRSFPSYFCLLSIVATFSLPSVCFSSLFSKLFLPPPAPFFLSGPNFLVELARKRLLRRLPFLLFLRSWRSFCDETVIFAKRLLTILQTSIAAPLLFQNVPRANGPTIYSGYSCRFPLSPSPTHPLLLWPLFALSFPSVSLLPAKYYFFVAIPNAAPEQITPLRDVQSEHTLCFLSLLIFPTVALKRLLFLLGSLCSTNSSWEHHIRADLLNNHDRKVRPVRQGRREVTVQFSLRVGRLVKVVRQIIIIFGTPF